MHTLYKASYTAMSSFSASSSSFSCCFSYSAMRASSTSSSGTAKYPSARLHAHDRALPLRLTVHIDYGECSAEGAHGVLAVGVDGRCVACHGPCSHTILLSSANLFRETAILAMASCITSSTCQQDMRPLSLKGNARSRTHLGCAAWKNEHCCHL